MVKKVVKDVYEPYGLDCNNPETLSFVSLAYVATAEFGDLLDSEEEPYLAFTKLVKA